MNENKQFEELRNLTTEQIEKGLREYFRNEKNKKYKANESQKLENNDERKSGIDKSKINEESKARSRGRKKTVLVGIAILSALGVIGYLISGDNFNSTRITVNATGEFAGSARTKSIEYTISYHPEVSGYAALIHYTPNGDLGSTPNKDDESTGYQKLEKGSIYTLQGLFLDDGRTPMTFIVLLTDRPAARLIGEYLESKNLTQLRYSGLNESSIAELITELKSYLSRQQIQIVESSIKVIR